MGPIWGACGLAMVGLPTRGQYGMNVGYCNWVLSGLAHMGPIWDESGLPYLGFKWACPHWAHVGWMWVALTGV